MDKKVFIFGCGISGATLARKLASHGWNVTIYEKNKYIGGNCYDFVNQDGVLVHKFGPHIFHTPYRDVFRFVKKFAKFNKYRHSVLCNTNNLIFPLPINFESIKIIDPAHATEIIHVLKSFYPDKTTITLDEMKIIDNYEVKKLYQFLYDNVYSNYTAKMWGVGIENVDPSVINRVKIILDEKNNYFPDDKYQGLPVEGYTKMIEKMVNHKNIKVVVNSPYELHFINEKLFIWNGVKDAGSVDVTNTKVVYCGRVDELFDYKYQKLGFRSLKIQFQTFNQSSYQPAPVINYPSDPNFTRITEYQKLTLQNNINKTTISHEYPGMWSEASTDFNTPYYPISNKENENIYHTYIKQIQSFNNFYLLGRLAQYKYFDMDDAIKNAFDLADKIISGK